MFTRNCCFCSDQNSFPKTSVYLFPWLLLTSTWNCNFRFAPHSKGITQWFVSIRNNCWLTISKNSSEPAVTHQQRYAEMHLCWQPPRGKFDYNTEFKSAIKWRSVYHILCTSINPIFGICVANYLLVLGSFLPSIHVVFRNQMFISVTLCDTHFNKIRVGRMSDVKCPMINSKLPTAKTCCSSRPCGSDCN